MQRVVVLHSELAEGAGKDEEDVLVQVETVCEALSSLGCEPVALPFSPDLSKTAERLTRLQPAFIFNLVETLFGSGRLIPVAPALLDTLGLQYTGSRTDAMFLTSNKVAAKRLLHGAGIATPPWVCPADLHKRSHLPRGRIIIKSVWEHASIGLDADSVLEVNDPQQLGREMEERREGLGGECFAERYIEGREFNLSILAGREGPEVLPPAEIRFDRFPADRVKVVCYRAKWEPDSFEFHHTPRSFAFEKEDEPLLRELKSVAKACWELFGLRGYARVDFRVDAAGKPWVLEVNANPCISPDAGFYAAAERAGLAIEDVVARIVEDSVACARGGGAEGKVL